MKRLLWSLVLLISLSLTGCIQKTYIKEDESDAVAEYMAGLLLKYDDEYDKLLIPNDDFNVNNKTDNDNKVSKDRINDANDKTDVSGGYERISDDMDGKTDKKEVYSLSDLTGQSDFDIHYSDYKLTNSYPENYNSTYISIEADNGYQLLVIKFNIKNNSKKDKSINLSDTAINYQLEISGKKISKPWFTALENDIQYIDMKIDKETSIEAVLIYQISKTADTNNMKLIVSRDKKNITIPIK